MAKTIDINWKEEFSEDEKVLMYALALTFNPIITDLKSNITRYQLKTRLGKVFKVQEIKTFFDKIVEIGFVEKIGHGYNQVLPGLRYEILLFFRDEYPEFYKMKYRIFEDQYKYSYQQYRPNQVGLLMAIFSNDMQSIEKYKKALVKSYRYEGFEEEIALVFTYKPFVQYLKKIDKEIFTFVIKILITNLSYTHILNIGLEELIRSRLDELDDSSICEFLNDFYITTLQLDKVLNKNNIENRAIIEFSNSNYDEAESLLAQYQIEYNNKKGARRKFLPDVYGFVYCLLLIRSGKTPSTIKTYVNNYTKEYKNKFNGLKYLYEAKFEGKENSAIREIKNSFHDGIYPFHYIALYWIDREKFEELSHIGISIVNQFDVMEYKLFKYTLLSMLDKCSIKYKFEKNDTYQISFEDLLRTEEDWEKNLKYLELLAGTKPKSKSNQSSRIIWEVDFTNNFLQPIEQKLTKSGSWSKGRNIALKRLKDNAVSNISEQDRRVASAIKTFTYGYYGGTEYEIDFEEAIEHLVNHPLLFLRSSPTTRVELEETKPELEVKQIKNGYIVSFEKNTQLAYKTQDRILKESLTKYVLYKFEPKLKELFYKLNKSDLFFPKDAKVRFEKSIHNLSPFININADFVTEQIPTVKADTTPILQMIPFNDGILGKLLVRPFKDEGPNFVPSEGRVNVVSQIKGDKLQTKRKLKTEKKKTLQAIQEIDSLILEDFSDELFYEDPENCLNLLSDLQDYKGDLRVEWPKGEKLKIVNKIDFGNVKVQVKKQNEWFSVEGEVQVDKKRVLKIKELIDKSSETSKEFIKLDDGQYLALTKQLKRQLDLLKVASKEENGEVKVHPLMSSTIEEFENSGAKFKSDKFWKENKKMVEEMKSYEPIVPSTLQAELRPYQKEGYDWMMRLAKMGVGACLADEMGLGKTVQSISMLIEKAPNGASLVVAPASVCSNWINEIAKFAPSLKPIFLNGKDRKKTIDNLTEFDVLVVSYGLVQTEIKNLTSRKWNAVVLDEAHAIKNVNTKRTKAIVQLEADFKLIATGTPLQNNLEELWSLFNFINPGLLFTQNEFNERFVNGADSDKAKKHLKSIIQPYILRRNKTQVLDDLPEKTEITLSVELDENETAFYEALREKAIENMESTESAGAKNMQVLAEITRLRQACCNPKLVDNNWNMGSSKLKIFERTLDDLLKNKHKCLVFSQFTSHLAILENLLKEKGISYQYLDGSTPLKTREKRVKAFQSGEGDVFLISLKAGGLGLNLTSADYVIHMDPWWNPAIEDQASDRAHRIGQQRPVTIYRMVTKNTIEEKIVKLHHTKRDMADSLLEGTDKSSKLTANDMIKLLKGTY
jgi:SNF2 family DNA or RNA helicase